MISFEVAVFHRPLGRLLFELVLDALLLVVEQPALVFQPLYQLLFKSSSEELPVFPGQLPIDGQDVYFNS